MMTSPHKTVLPTPTIPRFRQWNDLPYIHSNNSLTLLHWNSFFILFLGHFLPRILALIPIHVSSTQNFIIFHYGLFPFTLSSQPSSREENHLAFLFLKWSSIATSSWEPYYHFLLPIVLDISHYILTSSLIPLYSSISFTSPSPPPSHFLPGLLLAQVLCDFSPTLVLISSISFFTHCLSKWIPQNSIRFPSQSLSQLVHSQVSSFYLYLASQMGLSLRYWLKMSHLNVPALTKCNLF